MKTKILDIRFKTFNREHDQNKVLVQLKESFPAFKVENEVKKLTKATELSLSMAEFKALLSEDHTLLLAMIKGLRQFEAGEFQFVEGMTSLYKQGVFDPLFGATIELHREEVKQPILAPTGELDEDGEEILKPTGEEKLVGFGAWEFDSLELPC